jgi:hypothetical protein
MAMMSWRGLVLGALLGALPVAGGGASAAYADARPSFTQQGPKLTATGEIGSGDFGWSVALSADGNTALVSAPSENSNLGAAWVFTRSNSSWTPQAKLPMPTGETANGNFGTAVALSADGNTALVGASYDGYPSTVGAAWVFTRSGSTWTQQGEKLQPIGEAGNGQFGLAVALSADGNTAAIGAPLDTTSGGAGWIFTRSASTWTQQGQKLTGAGAMGSYFGRGAALSADGSTVLFGGPIDNNYAGAAWVFTRSTPDWKPQGGKLVPKDPVASPEFGGSPSLSADGSTALIGGGGDNGGAGAAWVFTRSGGAWTQQGSKLRPDDEVGNGWFGSGASLSSDGNTALLAGLNDNGKVGAAWIFTRSGSAWTQQGSKLTGSNEKGNGTMGDSVALSADSSTALIGGTRDSGRIGAAWVFVAPPAGPGSPPGQGSGFPRTTITSGPSGFTASAPTFTFTSDVAGSTFECRFDGGSFVPCTTPHTRYGLANGPHTFYVRAVSPAGVRDPSPDQRSFTLGVTMFKDRSCSLSIPWSLAAQSPLGPKSKPQCIVLHDRCPSGSLCTLTGSVEVTAAAEENISWEGGVRLSFTKCRASGAGPIKCDSATDSEFCASGPIVTLGGVWRPRCPHRGSLSRFGAGDAAVAICALQFWDKYPPFDWVPERRGDDGRRRLTCRARLRIEPAIPLRVLASGTAATLLVPSPGTLSLSAAKQATLGSASTARKRTPKPEPAIAPIRIQVSQSGPVAMPLTLSKRALTRLHRRKALPLRLTVAFTPADGSAPTRSTQPVTLRYTPCVRPRKRLTSHRPVCL